MPQYIKPKKNEIYLDTFQELYPKFNSEIKTKEFNLIFEYLVDNIDKLVWAIEDLDSPPLEGVGKALVSLNPKIFNNPNNRRMTGALIAAILHHHGYMPATSGVRVSWKPFITASKYKKKQKILNKFTNKDNLLVAFYMTLCNITYYIIERDRHGIFK